jgi:hypothetical protein
VPNWPNSASRVQEKDIGILLHHGVSQGMPEPTMYPAMASYYLAYSDPNH